MKEVLNENIFESFDKYIPVAVDAAVPTATQWGVHKSMGGLLWATYKATCRRNGIYSGASGPRDFNEELFDPISKHLAGGWERAFQRRLPSCVDGFIRTIRTHLEAFHREATQRARERNNNYNGLNMLAQQLQSHSQRISDIRNVVIGLAQELQREANRGFTPVIQDEMVPAYDGCVAERGKLSKHESRCGTSKLTPSIGSGSYMRMKNLMINHVTNRRGSMFRNATNAVQRQLENLCERMRQEMEAHMQDVHARLARDYLSVLVGVDAASMAAGVPRVELLLRSEMAPRLAKADGAFAEAFGDADQKPVNDRSTAEGSAVEGSSVDGTDNYSTADEGEEPKDEDFIKSDPDLMARDSIMVKTEADRCPSWAVSRCF